MLLETARDLLDCLHICWQKDHTASSSIGSNESNGRDCSVNCAGFLISNFCHIGNSSEQLGHTIENFTCDVELEP